MATLTKTPAYDSAGRAETTEAVARAEGGRFHRAWGASVLVHGVVIGLLVGLTLTVTKRVEDTEPFVVVPDVGLAEASGGDRVSGGVEAEVRAAALFTAPPSVPRWVPPRAAPGAAEVEVRDMTPMPRAKAESRVAGLPATKRPEEGANGPRTNYRDFQSANRPAARIGPGGPSGEPGSSDVSSAGPRVSVASFGPNGGEVESLPAAVGGGGMAAYFAGLMRQLTETHVQPAGLSELLSAEVRFTVEANGAISGVGIVRSSGSAAFDRSVLEAFARVKVSRRPDGKTDVRTATFRMQGT